MHGRHCRPCVKRCRIQAKLSDDPPRSLSAESINSEVRAERPAQALFGNWVLGEQKRPDGFRAILEASIEEDASHYSSTTNGIRRCTGRSPRPAAASTVST